MCHKTLYNLLFLFLVPFSAYGQRIVYDYDPCGSRRSLSSLPAGTYVVRLSRGGNAEEIKITKGK